MNAEIDKYNSYNPGVIDDICTRLDKWLGYDVKSDRQLAAECMERIEKENEKLETLKGLSSGMEEILKKLVEHNMIIMF